MLRFLHIDMDAFFPSVEQVLNPKLKGKPVIVGARPTERGVVSSASYEARRFGVHSAMPSVTAGRLCPQGIFIHGHHAEYLKYSRLIRSVFLHYTGEVDMLSLDEAYLDFAGYGLLYPDISLIGRRIQQEVFFCTGLTCSVGVASSRVVAKVASDLRKPRGFVVVPVGTERKFLSPLSVRRLPGIGPKSEQELHRVGMYKLGDIQQRGQKFLVDRWGKYGLMLWRAVQGKDSKPTGQMVEHSLSRETTFDSDTSNPMQLRQTLVSLIEKVCYDLRRHGRRAQEIGIKIRYTDFTTLTSRRRLLLATNAPADVLIVAEAIWRKLYRSGELVRLLGVVAGKLSDDKEQSSIFDWLERGEMQRVQSLNRSVDRLRGKYGFQAISLLRARLRPPALRGGATAGKLE